MGKSPCVVTIPGTRKVDRLIENCGSVDVVLTKEEITKIDEILNGLPAPEVYRGK